MLTVYGLAVAPFCPHGAAAARYRERPVETRDDQRREIADDAFNREMEAVTIDLFSRSQTGCEIGLMLLNGHDDRRDDGLKLRRRGSPLRIEPD
jgi:hypothetical protein